MSLSSTLQWDVRTTGADTNGGAFDPGVTSPGTDYSVQDAAQVAYTDLVIGGTNTQLTSAGHPFTSIHVGNVINITGGTGFTTGRYTVNSVSGSTATMDRAVGTASSTGGTGNLGGALQTLATAFAAIVSGNTIWTKSGTYTLTTAITAQAVAFFWKGYGTSHGDNGTRPLVTTSTNSTVLFNTNNSLPSAAFENLAFSNTATTKSSAIKNTNFGTSGAIRLTHCTFDGFGIIVDAGGGAGGGVGVAVLTVANCSFINSSRAIDWTGPLFLSDSYFANNSFSHLSSGGAITLFATRTIFNAGAAHALTGSGNVFITNCSFYANGTGLASGAVDSGSSAAGAFVFINNVVYGNGSGVNFGSSSPYYVSRNNAWGSNTSGNTNFPTNSTGDVTLTANPFTNTATGDFSLNSTAGGGAACKGAGFQWS